MSLTTWDQSEQRRQIQYAHGCVNNISRGASVPLYSVLNSVRNIFVEYSPRVSKLGMNDTPATENQSMQQWFMNLKAAWSALRGKQWNVNGHWHRRGGCVVHVPIATDVCTVFHYF
jgi:hypothetical protein